LETRESQLTSFKVILLFMWKQIHADLNSWAINLKVLQIVDHYVTYILQKFQIDSSQIEISTKFLFRNNLGLHFQNVEKILRNEKIPADLHFWGIDLKYLLIVDK